MYRTWLSTVPLALGLGAVACGTNPQGSLEIYLTDQPLSLQSVVVTISQVELHPTSGPWRPFYQGPVTVDLMQLRGTQSLLAMGNVTDGQYTGFRLLVQSGYVIDTSGQRCDLEVPSDKVEVPVVFEVQQGHVTRIVADFDGPASVQVVQTGNARKCILRPVINVKSVEKR
ncbi:hypothetical protein HRbin11_02221 [bacterium HR11]|nr:hypothetical protein HRbin11_02221 [bacterium HR11]